jgi:hypothetical protein
MSRIPDSSPLASALLSFLHGLSQQHLLSSYQDHWTFLAILRLLSAPEPLCLPQRLAKTNSLTEDGPGTFANPQPPSQGDARPALEPVQVATADAVQAIAHRLNRLEQAVDELREKVLDSGPVLLTKKAFLRHYPDLYSKSGLDKVVFMRKDNGLNDFGAIYQRKKGCRVLINPRRFLQWYRWFHGRDAQARASEGPTP